MSYSILQKSLQIPPVEALKRAFRSVSCLTDFDAFSVARDAYGILVSRLSSQDASSLHGALLGEGIETEIIEDSRLPQLPPSRQVHRLDCHTDHLLIFDPLGRSFPLPWDHVMLVAAGQVRLTEFQRVAKERPVVRYTADGMPVADVEREYSTRETLNNRLLLEIVISGAGLRYSAQGETFNCASLGDQRSKDPQANFIRLVREIARHCPQATLNRGAFHLGEQNRPLQEYPTRNAFNEELIWLLWHIQQASPTTS